MNIVHEESLLHTVTVCIHIYIYTLRISVGGLGKGLKFHIKIPNSKYSPNPPNSYDNA